MQRLLRLLKWWLIYLGPRRDVTVETSNGLLAFDSKDWLVGKYLYVKRRYEAEEIEWIIRLLRTEGHLDTGPTGCVMDVGANIGMISIALLKRGYFERAIAFEPWPNSYRLLVRNVLQNGLQDRVLHFPYALSSAEGQLELELSKDNSGDHRIRCSTVPGAFGEERRRTIRVEGKTLDQIMASHSSLRGEEVRLVWLDIQGHEGQFLEGARHFLSRRIPVVSEFWPYAIQRSGASRSEFCHTVSQLFTHFYLVGETTPQKRSIDRIDTLFDSYREPKQMCQLVFISEGRPAHTWRA